MKWTYSIQHKLAASGVLLALCALVLISNYLDRAHTRKVKTAISTLYEDRLIAEVYIYRMLSDVYRIREALIGGGRVGSDTGIADLLEDFTNTVDAYLETKFTPAETTATEALLATMERLKAASADSPESVLTYTREAVSRLDELTAIQLAESKQIMQRAETLYMSSKTSSRFVFATIIVIILVLQALVFSSRTLVGVDRSKSPSQN